MKKRLLSMALAVVLVLGAIAVPVFADTKMIIEFDDPSYGINCDLPPGVVNPVIPW
jgi:hypothetical protein